MDGLLTYLPKIKYEHKIRVTNSQKRIIIKIAGLSGINQAWLEMWFMRRVFFVLGV